MTDDSRDRDTHRIGSPRPVRAESDGPRVRQEVLTIPPEWVGMKLKSNAELDAEATAARRPAASRVPPHRFDPRPPHDEDPSPVSRQRSSPPVARPRTRGQRARFAWLAVAGLVLGLVLIAVGRHSAGVPAARPAPKAFATPAPSLPAPEPEVTPAVSAPSVVPVAAPEDDLSPEPSPARPEAANPRPSATAAPAMSPSSTAFELTPIPAHPAPSARPPWEFIEPRRDP